MANGGVLLIGLTMALMSVYEAEGRLSVHRGLATTGPASPGGVFDVTKYGAVGDGSAATNEDGDNANSLAFIQAWRAACDSTGVTRVVVPDGKFLVGPVLFSGPCKAAVTVEVQGTLLADTDITQYTGPEWLLFENIDRVTLTGTGVINGQGEQNWKYSDCKGKSSCSPLPTSVKYHRVNNSVIEGVQSVNPMFFHFFITNCQNITVRNLKLTAPGNSPNTDGIHIGNSDVVTVDNAIIATGDDCVSLGHGAKNITVTRVTCGPGHGISVGSLGKYDDEEEVRNVLVKNCTLIGTTNGARLKSWPGDKDNEATSITYEDIIMDHVQMPIIIDQHYGKKSSGQESTVKFSDIHFINIRGTSSSKALVHLACSSIFPCEGVELADIDLHTAADSVAPAALHKKASLASPVTCENAKVTFVGKHDGITC